MFAALVPVILFLAVLSVEVGNWWVHERRLQTQVDAAALAAGPSFTGCAQDAVETENRVTAAAARYAGDVRRDNATLNQQVQERDDVFVALNSDRYWEPSDGTSPGYGLDFGTGAPCSVGFLDVKATDHLVSPLWGRIQSWVRATPSVSPGAHAKIEIRQVQSTSGPLPFGVREIDPARVAAIFVNEDADAASREAVVGEGWLNPQSLPSGDPLSGFNTWRGDIGGVDLNGNENFGVVILSRRNDDDSLGESLQAMCGAPQTTCYARASSAGGLSFIHSYSDGGSGNASNPFIRQVELAGGCGQSAPYFNLDDGTSCGAIVIQAKIDFGATGDPTLYPTCATVSSSPGDAMTWSAGGVGGALGTWTGSFTPAVESGRTQVNLNWSTDNQAPAEPPNCGGAKSSGSFGRVAGPYVADADAGPVQHLTIESPPGVFANSINGNPSTTVTVTVGLIPPLVDAPLTAPPTRLRFRGRSSQARPLACDSSTQWRSAIVNGCQTPYQVNLREGSCADPNPEPLDCIEVETESPPDDLSEELRQGMRERFGGAACTPNHWDGTLPNESDPRWIALFIMGENTPGRNVLPIRRFGGFYVTAADGMGCMGDNPITAGEGNVWGHFVSYVNPGLGNTVPKAELCTFVGAGLCTPVLVE